MSLEYLDVEASFVARRSLALPEFLGARWRGSLGRALRAVSAHAYAMLYEPEQLGVRGKEVLKPMILLVPPPGTHRIPEGGTVDLGLRLFGNRAIDDLCGSKLLETAFEAAGEAIKLDREMSRPALALDRMHVSLPKPTPPIEAPTKLSEALSLELELTTPLSIRRKDFYDFDPALSTLVRFATERRATLEALYGNPACTFESPVVAEVHAEHDPPRRFEYGTPAHNGKMKRKLRGIEGRLRFSGPVHEALSILRSAEITAIGSDTTYGLGRIRVGLTRPHASLSVQSTRVR